MKAKWLFDEHPILVDKELASVIGLNEAIVLQQLNYWLHSKSAKQIDGRLWIYNTYDNWKKDNFPFWSRNTIRRALNSCIKKGLVITGNFNKAGFDKTKWYSINTQKLDEVMGSACDQNGQTDSPKWADGSDQNGQTNTIYYPETTSKTTTNNQAQPAQPSFAAQRREVVEYLNQKTGKHFKPNADGNKRIIEPRLKEGYTVDEMKKVIDNMYSLWHGVTFRNGELGDNYLKPETLFRSSKIDGYLNANTSTANNQRQRYGKRPPINEGLPEWFKKQQEQEEQSNKQHYERIDDSGDPMPHD